MPLLSSTINDSIAHPPLFLCGQRSINTLLLVCFSQISSLLLSNFESQNYYIFLLFWYYIFYITLFTKFFFFNHPVEFFLDNLYNFTIKFILL